MLVFSFAFLSNNCNDVFPPVIQLYSDTPGVALLEEHPYIA